MKSLPPTGLTKVSDGGGIDVENINISYRVYRSRYLPRAQEAKGRYIDPKGGAIYPQSAHTMKAHIFHQEYAH